MAKYYVESGKARAIFDAANATEAAVAMFQRSCDYQAGIECELSPEHSQETREQDSPLTDEIRVSELGFGRDDALAFDTLNIVAIWQGYLFPWMNGTDLSQFLDNSRDSSRASVAEACEAA